MPLDSTSQTATPPSNLPEHGQNSFQPCPSTRRNNRLNRGAEFYEVYEAQHRRRQIDSLKRKAANFGMKIIDATAA